MPIKIETIALVGVGVIVGYVIGGALEKQRNARRLLAQQVMEIGDVQGLLSPDQATVLQDVLDAGHRVVQERVNNIVMLLVDRGAGAAENLFTLPAADGSRQTLAEFQAQSSPAPAPAGPQNGDPITEMKGGIIDVGDGFDGFEGF